MAVVFIWYWALSVFMDRHCTLTVYFFFFMIDSIKRIKSYSIKSSFIDILPNIKNNGINFDLDKLGNFGLS